MSRERKYKAWNKVTEEWIEFFLIGSDGSFESWNGETQDGVRVYRPINKTSIEVVDYIGRKDRNGQEIYEGDIISWGVGWFPPNGGQKLIKGYVKFYKLDYRLYFARHLKGVCSCGKCSMAGSTLNLKDVARCRIIGNIYENPELLESS